MTSSPIFVFGALRSGTTLLRLMLKSHPELQSPGEADFLFDHVEKDADGAWRYDRVALDRDRIYWAKELDVPQDLDGVELAHAIVAAMAAKEPGQMSLSIHRNATKMVTLFPEAKVIHLLRDPRDVARSSIGMGWAGNSYYGVNHWIGTEQGWQDAGIDESKVLTVQFETLMSDLEGELSRICTFLGIAFDARMLKYYEDSTYGPPDPKIAQKWRNKATAREVALIEGRCGALLEKCGYTPAGAPAVPGWFEAKRLKLDDDFRRWRHNIRRYGLGLFLSHHVARLMGWKERAQELSDRQEAIRIASLK